MPVAAHPASRFISLQPVALESSWHALLLSVSEFPIPELELAAVKAALAAILSRLKRGRQLTSEVFLQLEQLHAPGVRELFARHAPQWIPEVGLGVWPHRDPPAKWSQKEFMEVGPNEMLRAIMFQVFRITAEGGVRDQAADLMLRLGPVLQILTADSDGFFEESSQRFLEFIKEPTYRCFPFYVPLLDLKAVIGASGQQLEQWLGRAQVYMRESLEDKGVLILSRAPLDPILTELGGQFESTPAPLWRIPY